MNNENDVLDLSENWRARMMVRLRAMSIEQRQENHALQARMEAMAETMESGLRAVQNQLSQLQVCIQHCMCMYHVMIMLMCAL